MPSLPHSLLSYLRVVAGAWRNDPREDAELLALFAESGDEAAFKALVCRHGPLVWQTCQRVLSDTPDAEDAFQTTFLALAHKAGRLRREPLAGWLHRVARQAALKVDIEARRRRNVEHHLRAVMQPQVEGNADRAELYTALDEELAGLPERLRVPLLLHYLEGRSQVEVARFLGCGRSVLQRRLARGEAILRQRLERRGLSIGVVSVGALLGWTAGASALQAGLIGRTVRAAAAFRSGALTGGTAEAARAMLGALPSSIETTILRKSLWIVLACCLGLGSATLVTYQSLSARPDEPGEAGRAATQAPGQPRVDGRAAARVDCYGDPLPAGALARMGTVRQWYGRLTFPSKTVFAFSPDDKTLVSQNCERKDGSVCLWDAATGKEIRWIANDGTGKTRWEWENTLLALSPDGQTLAKVQSGTKGNVYLWEAAIGKLLHQLKRSQEPKREAAFLDITFLPNGKILTLDEARNSDNTIKGDNRIYLWDVATGGREISQLNDPGINMRKPTFSRDGKMVAGAIEENKIQLWEVATGKKIHQLVGGTVNLMIFSPDSKTLAAGGVGICVWEAATGKLIHRFEAKKSGFSCLAYSPDGKTLLGGGGGCDCHLWDTATGKEIRSFGWKDIQVAVFSHDGKVLAMGDEVGVIRLWEVATGKEILPHKGHHERVISIAYSPDGKTLASLSQDKMVRLWEAATGKEILQLAKHKTRPWGSSSLAYSPDGKLLVSMEDDMLHLWDTATGKEIRQFQVEFQVLPGSLRWVTFSPDGKLLAAILGGPTQQVCLFQVANGKRIYTLSSVGPSVNEGRSVAFSPDGRMLAAPGTKDGTVNLWEAAIGKFIGQLPLKQDDRRVESLAFSPDGRILATSSVGCTVGDDKAHLWEVATGKEICQLNGPGWQGGWSLTFSPNGMILATVARDDNKIRLWEVASGKQIGQLSGHRSGIRCVAFSPDGKSLASCSDDLTCLVWDVTPFASRLKLVPARPLPSRALSPERLEAAWADLAKDPAQAYAAIRALQAVPAQAIPLLRERVRPVAPVADPKQLQCWIADLYADSFTVREKAQREIEKLGEVAVPALRQALKSQPALEVKRRLQALLAELEPKVVDVSPHRMRELRAVQVLESVGTAEAWQLLQALAKGVAGARLTVEAEAALARLAKRSAAKP